jgi:hypothetical protein
LALFEPPLVYLNCVYGDCDDEDSKLCRSPDLLFLAMESPSSSSSSSDLDSTIWVSKEKNEQFGRSDEIINAPNWITKEV